MRKKSHMEGWGSTLLGGVSLLLLIKLVSDFNGVRAGGVRPTPVYPAPASKGRPVGGGEDLSRYDPVLKLDLLQELDDRPLPEMPRNPFEFEAPPLSDAQKKAMEAAKNAPVTPQPPQPPQITLKILGYAEKAGGALEAYLADDTDVYVVHEGDSVANRYRILKISANSVTFEDEPSHQSVDVPIPQ
jgi:hypothetical protein